MNQQPQPAQENKMGVMPVHRLLLTMSGPMMLSMLIQALYNVVDSMFVSYISEAALTAVSLAYPMQNLMIAVATGTGVGINALLSRNLGEKNFVMANRTAGNAIFLRSWGSLAPACISRPKWRTLRSLPWGAITCPSFWSCPLAALARSFCPGYSSPRARPFTAWSSRWWGRV